MRYYNQKISSQGYVHSIDMVYVQYFSRLSPKGILEEIRKVHENYPDVRYEEHLDRPKHNKYDFFRDGVAFGGAYIDMGKYTDYCKETKEFHLLPMMQLRVNPNKYYGENWLDDLIAIMKEFGSSGWLRKFDYAVDIPCSLDMVKVFKSRKEKGLYKGTRYFGQAGRHNYCKIYDKQKDMKRQGVDIDVLTRVEHTIFADKVPSLEAVFVLSDNSVKEDLSDLKDTERAIVTMYRELKALGSDYELVLGRKMTKKLTDYLVGSYVLLDYGNYLFELVENIKVVFDVSDVMPSDMLLLQVEDDEVLPFD